ncbi:MAG: hypothetical protein QGG40_07090, partial [Myxococcota bacterium]|nr:hypothetical protein [Myxococcota bacterium]
ESGASGASFLLLPGTYSVTAPVSDPLYTTTTRELEVSADSTEFTVALSHMEPSLLEIPAFDPALALALQAPTGHRVELTGGSDALQVAAGSATVEVGLEGATESISYSFEIAPGQARLPLPTAMVFDSGGAKVSTLLPPGKDDERSSPTLAVPVPATEDGASFRVSTRVELSPGSVGRFDVTPELFAPVADYRSWEGLEQQHKKKKTLTITAGSLTTGLAAAGVYYLVQAGSTATEAGAITDGAMVDRYDTLVEDADRLGYTGVGLVSGSGAGLVATGLMVRVGRSLGKKKDEARDKFETSSKEPVPPPSE